MQGGSRGKQPIDFTLRVSGAATHAERDAESILITPLHRPTHPALGDPLLTAQAGLPNKLVVWKMVHSHGTLVPGEEREERTRGTHGTRRHRDGKRRVEYDFCMKNFADYEEEGTGE